MYVYWRYLFSVAILLSAGVFLAWTSGAATFTSIASDPFKLGSVTVLSLVFAYFFLNRLHGIAWRLEKDARDLACLEQALAHANADALRTVFCSQISLWRSRKRPSRIARAMISLVDRAQLTRDLDVDRSIGRTAFQNDVAEEIGRDVEAIESAQVFLMLLGFCGVALGIYLALSGQVIPKNHEQVAQFNFHMLSNLGLAYLTSLMGLGGGVVLLAVKVLVFNDSVGELKDRFNRLMFNPVWPIAHKIMQKETEHAEERTIDRHGGTGVNGGGGERYV